MDRRVRLLLLVLWFLLLLGIHLLRRRSPRWTRRLETVYNVVVTVLLLVCCGLMAYLAYQAWTGPLPIFPRCFLVGFWLVVMVLLAVFAAWVWRRWAREREDGA